MDEVERLEWHRLLGAFLKDHLDGQPLTVEVEVDLSLQQQLLDVAVVRRGPGPVTVALPDGLDDLGDHNLISFKSHREALDADAMDELIGHYVRYRKMVSPRGRLLPHGDFRVIALSVRYPREFASAWPLRRLREGVYETDSFARPIRVVVVHELPHESRNALLHLFSADRSALAFARLRYRVQSRNPTQLIAQLLGRYRLEGIEMPLDLDQWVRDLEQRTFQRMLAESSPEQILAGLTPEQRLATVRALTAEEQLAAISPDVIEELRRRLAAEKPQAPR